MPAVAALGGIDAVVVAFVLMILAVAMLTIYGPLLSRTLSGVPVIGAWLAARSTSLILGTRSALDGWIKSGLGALADAIGRISWAIWLVEEAAVAGAETIYNAIARVVVVTIPWVFNTLVHYALALFTQAVGYALALFTQAVGYALALFTQAVAFATALYQAALAYATSLYHAALAYATSLYVSALAYATSLYVSALAYATSLYHAAVAYALALYTAEIAYTAQAVLGAERYAEQVGIAAEGYALQLEGEAIRYAQQVYAQATAYALALALPLTAEITDIKRSPCMKACNVLGDLGQLLQDMQDDGLALALVALAAEAARDPKAAATVIEGAAGPPAQAAAAAVRQLAGV